MKVIFELSGEHPDLPRAEAASVAEILVHTPFIAVGECQDPSAARQLSLTHNVLLYLGSCPADPDAILALVSSLHLAPERSFRVRVKRLGGSDPSLDTPALERRIGSAIHGPVDLDKAAFEYRALVSGGTCFFGRVLFQTGRGEYEKRRPGDRPFFHPGVMMPRMARAIVNLARVPAGGVLLDPFCGTGGILLEASLLGIDAAGCDHDPLMAAGSLRNVPSAMVFRADARSLPVRDASADAIVTDLPYGQSVILMAESRDELLHRSLAEVARILRPGRIAVVVSNCDISTFLPPDLRLTERYDQRVHKSLTRQIAVLVRQIETHP